LTKPETAFVAARRQLDRIARLIDWRMAPALLWLDRLVLPIATFVLIRAYAHAHFIEPVRAATATPGVGWWGWYDQGKMLEAALAWARGDFSPVHHWYMPGYALLGAAFLPLTPNQPFFWPDLLGVVAALWLFTGLASRLGVRNVWAATLFLAVTLGQATILHTWVVPWNTSITTPLMLGCLLATLRISDRPQAIAWPAFLAGMTACFIPAFRPTDVLSMAPAAIVILWSVSAGPHLRKSPGADRRWRFRAVGGTLAGSAVAIGALAIAYLTIYGFHISDYVRMSQKTGFEWRLLPLRWVTLVVDPRPIYPNIFGLVEVFWWIVPGIAGAAACVWLAALPPRLRLENWNPRRTAHITVLASVGIYWALYLSYRDLHPTGMWVFENHHYFKWTLPIIAVYASLFAWLAVRLIVSCWRRALAETGRTAVALLIGTIAATGAMSWRPELISLPPTGSPPTLEPASHQVILPDGLANIRDAALIEVVAAARNIYFGADTISAGGRTYDNYNAFRLFPIAGGAMLIPLRSLPAASSVLTLDSDIAIDATVPVRLFRQEAVFGLPCWVPRQIRPAICAQSAMLPGPILPEHQTIEFDGRSEDPYLIDSGWSDDRQGRWTVGPAADLQLRLPQALRHTVSQNGVVIEVTAAGFVPAGSSAIDVAVSINGSVQEQWHYPTASVVAKQVKIPSSLIPPDGAIHLRFAVLDPRRPYDYDHNSSDRRLLGLRVATLRILPSSADRVPPFTAD